MARSLKSLMGRLNTFSRGALEAAAGLCISRTHFNVEIEHWFLKILEETDSDLRRICDAFGLDASRVNRELTRATDGFKTGNARNPTLAPELVKLVESAWLIASLEFGASAIRTGHLVVALFSDPALVRQFKESSRELSGISAEKLTNDFNNITDGSPEEEAVSAAPGSGAPSPDPSRGPVDSKTPSLDKYTQDLTRQAREGKIDAIVGRDDEIRQMVDILMRRRQNNPICTGEAGVGKTAVIEGLASQIARGMVPPPLRNVSIRSLDLGLLQAGAGVKGEFENRLKSVIEEVKASPTPIIMFIDEAHTMIGAGGAAGQGDAANLLKPALARGELRTIAATTWSEYKKYFEKDAALARRFQVVKVEEPTEDKAITMMRPVANRLEAHHKVVILSAAVEDAVRLSNRFLTGRQLPDKSVSVLDTACARVAVSQCAVPPPIEDLQNHLTDLETERAALSREEVSGIDHHVRIGEIDAERQKFGADLEVLKKQWEDEKRIVARFLEVRTALAAFGEESGAGTKGETARGPAGGVHSPEGAAGELLAGAVKDPLEASEGDEPSLEILREEQQALEAELRKVQGDTPLVYPWVDANAVAAVISGWTGIPMGKMLKDELATVRSLADILRQRVVGQDHALEGIAQRIQTAKANLDDPGKPIGVFLLVGPSGVGKTETALALADSLYGGERNLITINMSEFQEKHTVSSLKGAPPGYVGYGEGGVLTEAVRRKPYSVVLLDEIEKAHPDVLELFYQVFDKGRMDDGEGREINFKNTVILLTSNLGTETIMRATKRGVERPEPEALHKLLLPELQARLKPALVGRMVTIPFYPLADTQLSLIVRLKLDRVARRMGENQRVTFDYTDEVVQEVVSRCTEVDTGARNVDHILTRTLLPEMSKEVLSHMAEGRQIRRIGVRRGEDGGFGYEIEADEG